MAALTANRNTKERDPRLRRYAILAGEIIYAGGLAAINAAGTLEMASDKAGLIVVGRAEEYVDNSNGGLYAASKTGCFLMANSATHAVTAASIGSACYVEDDHTVSSNAGTNSIIAGYVFDVDATGVWLEIAPRMK